MNERETLLLAALRDINLAHPDQAHAIASAAIRAWAFTVQIECENAGPRWDWLKNADRHKVPSRFDWHEWLKE